MTKNTGHGHLAPQRMLFFVVVLFLILTACGGSNDSSDSTGATAIAFSIRLEGGAGVYSKAAAINCAGNGIATIEAAVYDSNNTLLASDGPWDCTVGSGAITGDMAGANRKVVIAANDSTTTIYRGKVTGITIADGETTDIGSVTLSPVLLSPDTGQITCYDSSNSVISCAGTGQDGEYSINPMRFMENSDGTVTDNVTGLMWQQGENASTYNWYEATGTAHATYNLGGGANVCSSLTLGGYNEWRLPNEMELMTIVNYGTYGPAIDTTYFPNTYAHYYWSSTTHAYYTFNAWLVYFHNGKVPYGDKAYSYYVRCVR